MNMGEERCTLQVRSIGDFRRVESATLDRNTGTGMQRKTGGLQQPYSGPAGMPRGSLHAEMFRKNVALHNKHVASLRAQVFAIFR